MDENKFEKKVNELCSEIYQKLSLLIDNDYILVDLPYHSNIVFRISKQPKITRNIQA